MKIPDFLLPYLAGKEYSNGLTIKYSWNDEDFVYESRFQLLSRLVRDKKIIHVGCVDHDPVIVDHKIARNKWLHKILCDAADRCVGIDINEKGILYLKEQLGYIDVMRLDITSQEFEPLLEEQWDYLLLPEVLEHIGNPVDFLSKIRDNFCGNVKQLLITVPNAFMCQNRRMSVRGYEAINSDHRFWFSPYTLAKIVHDAGYSVEDIWLCKASHVTKFSFFKTWFYRRRPMLRNTIVLSAKFDCR